MAFSTTALNAYVKRTYDDKYIDNCITQVAPPTYKLLAKETDGSGDNFSWLADADDVDGGSPDFTTAQGSATNNASTTGSKFLSDWMLYSEVAQISADIIGRTRNNDGAWARAVDVAMMKKMRAIAHNNAVVLQGQGWGEISQITSVSGSTFVPLVASDITKYVVGMPLHFSSSLNAAVLRSATVLYVTAVSYTVGSEKVTLSGTLASISAVNNDWCFRAGARQNSATPSRIVPIGLRGWFIDQRAGSADLSDTTLTSNFLTADRTRNSRLYGTFYDATGGGSLLGALIDASQEAITVGNAKKLRFFASKANYAQVAKDLQTQVQYLDNAGNKAIGTKLLTIYSDGDAEATLQVDRVTNDTQVWGYDPAQVVIKSIGPAPHIDNEDGLMMARQATSQGYEARWFQQYIYVFRNPMGGVRIQVS